MSLIISWFRKWAHDFITEDIFDDFVLKNMVIYQVNYELIIKRPNNLCIIFYNIFID